MTSECHALRAPSGGPVLEGERVGVRALDLTGETVEQRIRSNVGACVLGEDVLDQVGEVIVNVAAVQLDRSLGSAELNPEPIE